MEIKRRLNAAAKRLTPAIESMNVGQEMLRMCDRFDELINYAEEKIGRSAARTITLGAQADRLKKEELKANEDQQKAEAEENLKDQQEAFDERNNEADVVSEEIDAG